ncbi:MAG: caspase family protein [Chitinophagaceae bacterium]
MISLEKKIFPALLLLLLIPGFTPVKANPGVYQSGTYVLEKKQYPLPIKKAGPAQVYLVYNGPGIKKTWASAFLRGDTILNLKAFLDSTKTTAVYRLIFGKSGGIDSVWQTNESHQVTDKAYPSGEGKLLVQAFDQTGTLTDQFVFNYFQKYKDENKKIPSLSNLFRIAVVYTPSDKNRYSARAAWVLSIGINKYEGGVIAPFQTSESDAEQYIRFFRQQFREREDETVNFSSYPTRMFHPLSLRALRSQYQNPGEDSLIEFHPYLLLGTQATREAILTSLRDIASKAGPNDYFIFCFGGASAELSLGDETAKTTFFFPYDRQGIREDLYKRGAEMKDELNTRFLSLKVIQEHIQLIPARNQLIISEAGNSENFKTEFIRTLIQESPAIASLLDINRVILVPDKIGLDVFECEDMKIAGAPIAYALQSLDSSLNVYDLFAENSRSGAIASALTSTLYTCGMRKEPYFEVFFERKFLRQYRDIFGDAERTRGGETRNLKEQVNPALKGNRYALIIGTDHYKGRGWDPLNNPVFDATEIASILKEEYSYQVNLLIDPPMDSIYASIKDYHRTLKPDDQLVIYVAGHGDYDKELLDDGFIVCHDSRSIEDDPLRNTYIQHTKLKKMINKMPARQVLVMLDICYGGFFDEQVRENPASRITNRNVLELLHQNEQYVVRKMLSSVGTEPAFDGKAGKHSPFASYLISVLNARGGAEGIITLSDIYTLLQKASRNETATLKISPHVAGFGDNNPLGEFILVPYQGKE